MRRGPKVEPFRHRVIDDPDLFARRCKEVTDAIHKFFVGDYQSMAFETLYRTVYQCVLVKFGEELYSAVEAALASGVQDLFRALDAGQDDDDVQFLRELVDKWNQHTKALTHTRDIVMYMDRTYVLQNKKTPIHELGVRLWRDNLVCSEKVWSRLIEAVRRRSVLCDEKSAASSVPDELKSMLQELGGEIYHQVMNPQRPHEEVKSN